MPTSDERDYGIRLSTAVVVEVGEQACLTWTDEGTVSIAFAPQFPTPRVDRVSPGHLVAIATTREGRSRVVWRWFDVVILDCEASDLVRLWEPGHGELSARGNNHFRSRVPGSRAYASAGLRGPEWWVAGPAVENPSDADVELDEVRALYDDNHMWPAVFGGDM
jgi:hypothetical protein